MKDLTPGQIEECREVLENNTTFSAAMGTQDFDLQYKTFTVLEQLQGGERE